MRVAPAPISSSANFASAETGSGSAAKKLKSMMGYSGGRIKIESPSWPLVSVAIRAGVAVFADFLFRPLARQGLLYAALFSRLQVIRMPLHFLDDVLGLYLAFEPAERVLQRLAFLQSNFCQNNPPGPQKTGTFKLTS